MKNTVPAYVNTLPQMRVEVSDVAQLIRPRLALLVLVAVAAGFCLASEGRPNPVNRHWIPPAQ
jgi:heme O synthase-like polyprenyltransferase